MRAIGMSNQQLTHMISAEAASYAISGVIMELPDKQAKWIYARFYLGMTVKEIAQAEGVDLSWVYKSIRRGLKHLAKKN